MFIETIHSPADVKALDYGQLEVLAAEIRQLIVESAIRASGHLGSNLGVVELTLALHRVFDSPRDIMLWDTGHQAYVHKIVTGRSEDFETCAKPADCRAIRVEPSPTTTGSRTVTRRRS